jgi:hypothetical protein
MKGRDGHGLTDKEDKASIHTSREDSTSVTSPTVLVISADSVDFAWRCGGAPGD